jgi:hypothetical protein
MARNASHPLGRGVMDFPQTILFCRRQAVIQGWGRTEIRIPHAQGLKEVMAAIDIQRLSRYPSDDFPQDDKIQVAVQKPGTRGMKGFLPGDFLQGRFVPRPFRLDPETGPKPGVVSQKLADGDPLFSVSFELRPVFDRRVIQTQLSPFHELKDRGSGGHDLG